MRRKESLVLAEQVSVKGRATRRSGMGEGRMRPGAPIRRASSAASDIGFLGAGIIVKGGLNVRRLTTADFHLGSSAIGILVGLGFYLPVIGLTALFVASVSLVSHLEQRLPARVAIAATLRFRQGYRPHSHAW